MKPGSSAYLRPTAPIASDVLLPADPGLAMALATRLTTRPRMANHHHGLWGYSGTTAAGLELTVQATGIGGPSATAVLGELAALGARRLIRIGRCVAVDSALAPGDTVLAVGALGADGTTAALGGSLTAPDRTLAAALQAEVADARPVAVASHDLGAGAPVASVEGWVEQGIAAVDRETAPLFAAGAALGLQLAAGLVVDEGDATERAAEVEAALLAIGEAAARAFSD